MNFDYIREAYDVISDQLFQSSFMITATIHISSEEVAQRSTYDGYGDYLDARQTKKIQKNYPGYLEKFYRIKVFPVNQVGIRQTLSSDFKRQSLSYGMFSPYEFWIACRESDVSIRGKTYFDFAEKVVIQSTTYSIKGLVDETFGNKKILYIYLEKVSA